MVKNFDTVFRPKKAEAEFEASFKNEAIASAERLVVQEEARLQKVMDTDPRDLVPNPDAPHSGRLEQLGRERTY